MRVERVCSRAEAVNEGIVEIVLDVLVFADEVGESESFQDCLECKPAYRWRPLGEHAPAAAGRPGG